MKKYLVKFELKSYFSTPLMSDTLFGHICWGVLYNDGEKALLNFLEENRQKPKLLLSDGFPQNYLPMPLLKPDKGEDVNEQKDRKKYAENKKYRKKVRYIKKDFIFEGKKISFKKVCEDFEKGNTDELKIRAHPEFIKVMRTRNVIDRYTQTATDGGLFSVDEIYLQGEKIVDLYAVTEYEKDVLKKYINFGIQRGYGADKSTGAGIFEIKSIEETAFPEKGDYLLALSSFIPSENEILEDLRAEIMTKFGKIGDNHDFFQVPFKKPMIMFRAGASFMARENDIYAGRMLEGIHKIPGIVHSAYAPLIRFTQG